MVDSNIVETLVYVYVYVYKYTYMPNITVYIPGYLHEKYKDDPNSTGLVSRLLAGHYAMTQPGIHIPKREAGVDKAEYQKKISLLTQHEERLRAGGDPEIIDKPDWGA